MGESIPGVNAEGMPPISEPSQQTQTQAPAVQTQTQPVHEQQTQQQQTATGLDDNSREGFTAALQAERTKATIEAQKAEFYRQQLAETIRQQSQPQQHQVNNMPAEPEYNPDEIPDVRTVEQILNKRLEVVMQQTQEMQRQTWINSLEVEARKTYPDYDKVVEKAMELAQYVDPGYKAAILNAKNPAEMAYTIGKLHPDFKTQQERQLTGQSTLNAIQANAQKPPTLSNIKDGGSVQQQAGFYRNMPNEEWQAKLARIKSQA